MHICHIQMLLLVPPPFYGVPLAHGVTMVVVPLHQSQTPAIFVRQFSVNSKTQRKMKCVVTNSKKQSKTNNKSSPSSYAITPIKQSAMIMHVEEIGFIVFLPQSANKWQIFACFLLNFLFLFFQKSNYLHFLFESIEHADTYTILKHTNLNCKWVWVARNLFRVRKIFLLIVLFKRDWNLFGIASILHQNVLARRL